MFIDQTRINISSGKGGDGGVAFARNRKPNGGNGGDGGNVYLEGSVQLYDLRNFDRDKTYRAGAGERGGSEGRQGKNGDDLVLKVPLTTVVTFTTGSRQFEFSKDGERLLLLKGGRGGLGNAYFKRGQLATLHKFTHGDPAEEAEVNLALTLESDVVFIGLPNAGKSSMLNALSRAHVKVAAYPFTTLEPQKALCDGMVLLDLPGLIEGTSTGKGLGPRFMKHAQRSKLLAHFISLEAADPLADYKSIREELGKLGGGLAEKKEVLVFTKADLLSAEQIKATLKLFKGKQTVVTSVKDQTGLEQLVSACKQLL